MKKILIIAISFLLVTNGFSQNDDSMMIKKISDEILTNGKAYDNLHYLTKQIGGRLSGSPQMVKAEKWGVALMKETGADKAWLQECMVPHWVRGGKDKAEVTLNGAVTGAKICLHHISSLMFWLWEIPREQKIKTLLQKLFWLIPSMNWKRKRIR